MFPFIKMHGLGNDFIIFDFREVNKSFLMPYLAQDDVSLKTDLVQKLSHRTRGIGCDQLIILYPNSSDVDAYMHIQNADGSTVGACGNATRCIGDYLLQETGGKQVTLRTQADRLTAIAIEPKETKLKSSSLIQVNMGKPRLDWQSIPLSHEMDTSYVDLTIGPLSNPVCINMGNPHAVFFVKDIMSIDLEHWGAEIETHALFPERVNVSIVEVLNKNTLRHRVWERGAGITEACGTAACATIVAATIRGYCDHKAIIQLDGGDMELEWTTRGDVLMTGSVSYNYQGQVDFDQLIKNF